MNNEAQLHATPHTVSIDQHSSNNNSNTITKTKPALAFGRLVVQTSQQLSKRNLNRLSSNNEDIACVSLSNSSAPCSDDALASLMSTLQAQRLGTRTATVSHMAD